MDNNNNTIYKFIHALTNERIIYAQCRPATGQIGILDVTKEYQRQGFGKETIKYLEREWHREYKSKIIWVACSREHYYWSTLPDFQYKQDIHQSVNSGGYYKVINE